MSWDTASRHACRNCVRKLNTEQLGKPGKLDKKRKGPDICVTLGGVTYELAQKMGS